MSYKDKDKQRQAVREATRRYRQKVSRVSQDKAECVIPSVIPDESVVLEGKDEILIIEPQSHNPMMVGYVPPRTS